MKKRIFKCGRVKCRRVMTDKIFPFLWHHGESKKAILKEIEKIYECGIRAFCVESRPHPDFCGPQWWEDMGFILREAQKRDMRVWLLDDKHYPSGSANGAVATHEELRQTNVMLTYMDVCGPMTNAKILLTAYKKQKELVGAFAFPTNGKNIDFYGGIDLTRFVHDNVLYWDIPVGHYRVFAVYTTKDCAEWDFVDILNPQSTALMIEEIYQPHYEHFSKYFGNTFVGFFSDEPRFGNGKAYDCQTETVWTKRGLGIIGMAYPWSDEIISALGIKDMRVLVSLWHNLEIPECAQFRTKYMNYLTDKFAENFSGMLGKWCEEHGVMYSGHIIEDEGAHAITCCSAGHYFKATMGQSIAGIDVVYNQVDLDFIDETHSNGLALPYVNDTFYNFALAKLASSAAHLDRKKEGRALCEIFGAFGWGESIAKMKKLVDFMLVRGINHFIPHAFNPFTEDEDSPPYFYCGGLNPQYDSFKTLSAYMLEMSEIFNGGKTDIRVAVLYHAEAVWSGYQYMAMEDVCKYLAQRQIDYDIVPEYEIKEISHEGIVTENCQYQFLIVPYRKYLDRTLKEKLEKSSNVWIMPKTLDELEKVNWFAYSPYKLLTPNKHIRVYKYIKSDKAYYFIFNEGKENYENELFIEETGYYVATDKQSGLFESGKTEGKLSFALKAGQSVLFEISNQVMNEEKFRFIERKTCEPLWKIYTADAPFTEWKIYDETKELYDLASWEHNPEFCGKIRYVGQFTFDGKGKVLLDFGESSCGIRVKLNGVDLGERIATPYVFDTDGAIKSGENELDIVVTTTLGLKKRDCYSRYAAIGKYGLPQNPVLHVYAKSVL